MSNTTCGIAEAMKKGKYKSLNHNFPLLTQHIQQLKLYDLPEQNVCTQY